VRVTVGLARVNDLVEGVAAQMLDVDELDDRLVAGQCAHERLRHRAKLRRRVLDAVHLHARASGDDRQNVGRDAIGERVGVGRRLGTIDERAQLLALPIVQLSQLS
jgi:hypothetical protein